MPNKPHAAAVRARSRLTVAGIVSSGPYNDLLFDEWVTDEYAPLVKAAQKVANHDWGTSVTELYHYLRITDMEHFRDALRKVVEGA